MTKSINYFYTLASLFLGLLATACHENKADNTVDIENTIEKSVGLKADELIKSVRPVALETNKNSLLGKNTSILHIDSNNILVYSDYNVKRFDSKGKYICDIGVNGNGHGEHGTIMSFAYNRTTDEVLMCGFDNKLYKYDINGKFKGLIQLQTKPSETVRSIICTGDKGCWGIGTQYTDSGISLRLCQFTENGKLNQSAPIYNDDVKVNVGRESFPLFWEYNGMRNVKLDYDENIYTFDNKLERKSYRLYLGDIAPNRKTVEDMEYKSQLLKEKCQVLNILETGKHYFLTTMFRMKYHLMIVSKDLDEVIYNGITDNPKLNGGIEYSAMGDIRIWPTYYNGEYAACIINADNLPQMSERKLKEKFNISVKRSDNPIIMMLQI